MSHNSEWTTIIKPQTSIFHLDIKEILKYRDLLFLFVKRDIVTMYKQTILGPLWFIIQPIMTTGMFTFVFGNLANISTDGVPHIVFYLLGITIWNYFSDCLTKTSNVFVANQGIFGKVYFPRVIMPASIIVSNLGKFFIQFSLFLCVFVYYYFQGQVDPNINILLLPFIVFIMAITSLGFGMFFSSLTTKYRDLQFLLTFGVQLWMYATPVIYPLSTIPEKYQALIRYNPIAPLIESIRYAFLGKGDLNYNSLLYSLVFGILIFSFGLLVFNKVEKSFMDTV
jgi:lipopolysaccharide transport system permease protein